MAKYGNQIPSAMDHYMASARKLVNKTSSDLLPGFDDKMNLRKDQ